MIVEKFLNNLEEMIQNKVHIKNEEYNFDFQSGVPLSTERAFSEKDNRQYTWEAVGSTNESLENTSFNFKDDDELEQCKFESYDKFDNADAEEDKFRIKSHRLIN